MCVHPSAALQASINCVRVIPMKHTQSNSFQFRIVNIKLTSELFRLCVCVVRKENF